MSADRVKLRPDVAEIVPYRQGRAAAADAFKLSSNENPFDPLPSVAAVLRDLPINRYPEGSAAKVRDRIGQRYGVRPEQVIVTSGAVALIGFLLQATCRAEDEVVFSWRSFEGYPQVAGAVGVRTVPVPNRPDGGHDIPAMITAVNDRTRLVLLCSPNNPTSTIVTRAEFETFMAAVPSTLLVALDEAYVEFVTDPDAVHGEEYLDRYPNLIVLRTFSKAYGLAGLRIGYGVGPEYVMDALRAVATPLAVTEAAQVAALVSLDHEDELLARVAVIVERRDRIAAALRAQGWDVPEAQGNFVWLATGPELLGRAAATFEEEGVVVRPLGEGLRVSIGEEEAVDKLLRSAEKVVAMLRQPTGARS